MLVSYSRTHKPKQFLPKWAKHSQKHEPRINMPSFDFDFAVFDPFDSVFMVEFRAEE